MKSLKNKIIIIVGARPNFVKAACLINELEKEKPFDYILAHTGQHYDFLMSNIFFEDLEIPAPHINLEVRSDKYPFTSQIAIIKEKLQRLFLKEKPELVLVFGDCNSAIAGALAAKSLNTKILTGQCLKNQTGW
jgi:UDP-N-acetylglucosamine 2-epimerase